MKRISLLLTSLILFCGWVGAQDDKISFNETEHDFGTIGERNGSVTCDFVLTNNSAVPILITNATASCGCTRPVWTKEPIEPGKKGTVSVTYNPLGRVAPFDKPVMVYINTLSKPMSLKIKGTVVAGELVKKKPEEIYPVALGNYLLKTNSVDFGQINLNKAKTIRMEVFNNSDQSVVQKTVKLPKYLAVAFDPVIIPAKTAGSMEVTINANESSLYGNLSGAFTLLINEVHQSIPYSATVLDDFSQWSATKKASAGKINLSASELNFGNFSSGTTRTLKISNSGKSVLNIRSIRSLNPAVTVSKSQFTVNPGEIVDVKINADAKKFQSKLSSNVLIVSDDPNTPVSEITILATNRNP